jgi:transposase
MLKDSEISRDTNRKTHRTYTPEFKAQLVAACQRPGSSIAALAGQHGMNANVVHRWLKEHLHSGRHQLVQADMRAIAAVAAQPAAFIPLALPAATPAPESQEIKIELRKGGVSIIVTWPLSAIGDLADWTTSILK